MSGAGQEDRILEEPQVHGRVRRRELADDEGREREDGQQERERDHPRVEPVVAAALFEEVLERGQSDPHQQDAEPVQVLPLLLREDPVVLEQFRILVHEGGHHEQAQERRSAG